MKRDVLLQLKHLLTVVDRLEFNVEQNRKQIAETRLLVANVARSIYFEKKSSHPNPRRKSKRTTRKKG